MKGTSPVTRKPEPGRPARQQPIRDSILGFMSMPRSAGEIAAHIDRPVPTATGHLRAMINRGLVRRIAFGTYAPAAYTGPAVRIPQRCSGSTKELRHRLRELLGDYASVQWLHLRTGEPENAIRVALRDLWFSGLAEGNETTGYRLVQRKHRSRI